MKKVLAFDFGASSGRAIIGIYDNERIALKEIHRFENNLITENGHLRWDLPTLLGEIKTGLKKASEEDEFESIGIDTWGVDFGLIDADGKLIENPVNYRDSRTDNMIKEAFEIISQDKLYERTGIQILQINTLFQFLYLAKYEKELLAKADKALFMPDLFAYLLTGEKRTEYTIASTSQMINPFTKDWDTELLDKFNIPKRLLCEIEQPPAKYGQLSDEICQELNIKPAQVVSVASHDTASAVVAVPTVEDDFIYISCGTWSLFGTELDAPIVNEKTAKANLTNEGGYGGKIRFLKNIMGLWLIQEARRQWRREGTEVSYADLEREALKSKPFACFIDPDSSEFLKPGGIHEKIRAYCERTNQHIPQTTGEIMRCIYESLAMKYRYTLEEIQNITDKKYASIYIVGGGIKDNLLCQMTANSCNLPVSAGPAEATALGNVALQLISMGEIKDLKHARTIIKNSVDPVIYKPSDRDLWDEKFEDFKKVIL